MTDEIERLLIASEYSVSIGDREHADYLLSRAKFLYSCDELGQTIYDNEGMAVYREVR